MIPINLVYEDVLSGEAMKKILHTFQGTFIVNRDFSKNGFGYIKKNISKFNAASKQTYFFILTDLDLKECAVSLRKEWLKEPINENLIFRVAVKEIEAWLLADTENFASFIGINAANIPSEPEKLQNPKQEILNICKKSKNRSLREDIIPKLNTTAKQGPNYNSRLIEYIKNFWDVQSASKSADSLYRCVRALEVIAQNSST